MGVIHRMWDWIDDRTGFSGTIKPLLDHPSPAGAKWSYVFGSATLVAFLVQVLTGIGLSSSFVTSTSQAYDSLQFISHDPFGRLLRGMHYWGASAMVLFIGLHMAQVFLIAAYKYPRELNWLSGVLLLAVTLGMAFTGQLLRWDQTAVWSIVVAAAQAARAPLIGNGLVRFILAGDNVGGATLSRFFAFHVFFIPAIVFTLIGLHLFLVLYHGISEPPKVGRPVDPKTYRKWYHEHLQREGVPFWPDAAWRDVAASVAMVAVIVGLAAIIGPPALEKPPDPTILEAYPRPDWYFLWYFAVLALIPNNLEDYIIILAPLLAGGVLFALPFISNKGERSMWSRPWAMASVVMIVMMIGTLWILGEKAPWSPAFAAKYLPPEVVHAQSAGVSAGANLYHEKGCENCHAVGAYGGARGPNLTYVGDRLTTEQLTTRILNGGYNMPAYGGSLTPQQLDELVSFLQSRKRLPASNPNTADVGR
ncbi:MAG: cytochrome bc complex cytochrome b subunit [Herpetosiphon sp.]